MPGALDGRIALVTGASGGIGRELALGLASAGAALALGYGNNRHSAEQLAAELESTGSRVVPLGADLSEVRAADELIDLAEEALGPVDVLVANAGIGRIAAYDDVDAALFDETIAVNLRAPFLLARRLLPGMRERGFGRLLFISSVAALTGGIVGPHYAASKAGLHGLTHYLSSRVAGDGVTVNAIAPALIAETGMVLGDPAQLAAHVPVGRTNAYMTNQVVSIDGGIHPR